MNLPRLSEELEVFLARMVAVGLKISKQSSKAVISKLWKGYNSEIQTRHLPKNVRQIVLLESLFHQFRTSYSITSP